MSNSELALLRQQMAILETRVKHLEKPPKQQWVTSTQAEKILNGKMSSFQIRKTIDRAIDRPENSTLIAGTHFLVIANAEAGGKNEYKINIPKWDEWLISTSLSLGTN
jgi:hypothetical protein